MFKTLRGVPSLNKLIISSATIIAASLCASLVEAAICGVNTILSNSNNLESSAGGSSSYTSSAAHAILSFLSASYNASSSLIPPRAQFVMNAVSFIISNSLCEIKCLVSGVNGT